MTLGLFLYSCNGKTSNNTTTYHGDAGILTRKIQFYNSSGQQIYLAPMKIWYLDSVAIEELGIANIVTDTFKRTTISFIPRAYKYIDLRTKSWYDYTTFSDTSQIINKGILDTLFPEGGWAFYTNSVRMKSKPEALPDTMIAAITYKRVKFSPLKSRPTYMIGYLRCDNKGKLFSLEKDFSYRVNCVMTRCDEFKEGASRPFASSELEFLSDTLSEKEAKVFSALDKNQRNNPVH